MGHVFCVISGRDGESDGVVIEDFAEGAGYAASVGDTGIAHARRRWVVVLVDGRLLDTSGFLSVRRPDS